jgi:hypothetical protein
VFFCAEIPWPGSSRVPLSKKGSYPGAAGVVERTRSAGPRACAPGAPSAQAAADGAPIRLTDTGLNPVALVARGLMVAVQHKAYKLRQKVMKLSLSTITFCFASPNQSANCMIDFSYTPKLRIFLSAFLHQPKFAEHPRCRDSGNASNAVSIR